MGFASNIITKNGTIRVRQVGINEDFRVSTRGG